jgi:hypothetical protein
MIRPLTARSYLFAPGHKPHIFAKAVASGADMVILDLEDAVAPDAKAGARDAIAAWLSADTPVAVRINGTDTSWWEEDLAICQHPGVAVVVVPKAEDPDALKVVAARLPPGVRLLPQIESARGLQQAGPMARLPARSGSWRRSRRVAGCQVAVGAGLSAGRTGGARGRRHHELGFGRRGGDRQPTRASARLWRQTLHPPEAGPVGERLLLTLGA